MTTIITILLYLIAAKGKISVTIKMYTYFKINLREPIRLKPYIINRKHLSKHEYIDIGERSEHPRKYKCQIVRVWLMFEVGYKTTELSEVGKIYPAGYDKSADVEWGKKLDRLQSTGYFA